MSAFRSAAMIAAILFSNPSSLSFVKGRLFGSAAMRMRRRGCVVGAAASGAFATRAPAGAQPAISNVMMSAHALRQRKDIQRSAFGRDFRQIGHSVDEAQRRRRVTRIEVVGNDHTRPAAYSRQHSQVLFAVGAAIADGLTDDARAALEFPKLFTGLGVD